jgi:DNA-binding NarL/FixJ family response regulator
MRSTTRVVVAVGPSFVCEALAARLSQENDLNPIAIPGTAAPVVAALKKLAPAVIVADPAGAEDGELSIIATARTLSTRPPVVALVAEGDSALTKRLIANGVLAVVIKTAPTAELVNAVRWSAVGAGWISPSLVPTVLDEVNGVPSDTQDPLGVLTARENEVVQLMVDGLGRKEIADRLYLSVDTVRTHMRTVMEKLDAHTSTAVVSVALSAGLRPRS